MRHSDAYKRYLKSPRWEAKRKMYFAKYGRVCQACKKRGGPLNLHHKSYDNLFNEPLADLVALCLDCHREVEALHRKSGRRNLRATTMKFIRDKRKR